MIGFLCHVFFTSFQHLNIIFCTKHQSLWRSASTKTSTLLKGNHGKSINFFFRKIILLRFFSLFSIYFTYFSILHLAYLSPFYFFILCIVYSFSFSFIYILKKKLYFYSLHLKYLSLYTQSILIILFALIFILL